MNPLETLTGIRKIDVPFTDGTTSTVAVRSLPIRAMDALLDAQNDEAALVALYCDKPPEWADTVTHSGIESILAAGEELNLDFFARWLQRKYARLERINGGLRVLFEKATSLNGSPMPASPPDSPSIKPSTTV